MSIKIPPRPPEFNTPAEINGERNPEYEKAMMKHNEAMFTWQQAVQQAQQEQNRDFEMKSNMSKANNDAMQSVIRNLA